MDANLSPTKMNPGTYLVYGRRKRGRPAGLSRRYKHAISCLVLGGVNVQDICRSFEIAPEEVHRHSLEEHIDDRQKGRTLFIEDMRQRTKRIKCALVRNKLEDIAQPTFSTCFSVRHIQRSLEKASASLARSSLMELLVSLNDDFDRLKDCAAEMLATLDPCLSSDIYRSVIEALSPADGYLMVEALLKHLKQPFEAVLQILQNLNSSSALVVTKAATDYFKANGMLDYALETYLAFVRQERPLADEDKILLAWVGTELLPYFKGIKVKRIQEWVRKFSPEDAGCRVKQEESPLHPGVETQELYIPPKSPEKPRQDKAITPVCDSANLVVCTKVEDSPITDLLSPIVPTISLPRQPDGAGEAKVPIKKKLCMTMSDEQLPPSLIVSSYHYKSKLLCKTRLCTGEQHSQHLFVIELGCQLTSLPNGKILVSGGDSTDAAYEADLKGNFRVLEPMISRRSWHGAVASQGFVYMIGGELCGDPLLACEKFSLARELWEKIPDIEVAVSGVCPIVLEATNKLYAVGGKSFALQNLVQEYNITSASWRVLEVLVPQSDSCIPCFKLRSDSTDLLFVCGGSIYSLRVEDQKLNAVVKLPSNVYSIGGAAYYYNKVLYCSSNEGFATQVYVGSFFY